MGTIEGDDGSFNGHPTRSSQVHVILIGPGDISHLVIWATGREAMALASANAI
jgi:hypothetical protein